MPWYGYAFWISGIVWTILAALKWQDSRLTIRDAEFQRNLTLKTRRRMYDVMQWVQEEGQVPTPLFNGQFAAIQAANGRYFYASVSGDYLFFGTRPPTDYSVSPLFKFNRRQAIMLMMIVQASIDRTTDVEIDNKGV